MSAVASTLLRDGTVVTMNDKFEVLRGDLRFEGGVIRALGSALKPLPGETVIELGGAFVIPGLIQAHTHLVQTLFRGLADDLELLDWLKKKIWPFESAHDAASVRASARLGLAEMQLSGTTSILDMGTVRWHEEVFAEAEHSGMRYWGGNCLMDRKAQSGPLYRPTAETLEYCEELIRAWHLKTPLLRYAISPRFGVSCTDRILKAATALQNKYDLIFHTHASENRGECALVRRLTGLDNVKYFLKLGCLGPRTVLAHAIHLKAGEVTDLVRTRTGITHCPSSNLKLASGIAPIQRYLRRGVKVALGSDGAACNNMMDAFMEIRLAALLQKSLFGPTALPAREAFALATRGGAEVLNSADRIGSLEPGKRADIVVVDRSHPSVATVGDPYSALVYSCTGRDVRDVWIDGVPVVRAARHSRYDLDKVHADAARELKLLLARTRP